MNSSTTKGKTMAKLVVRTFYRGRNEHGEMIRWEGSRSPCSTETTYPSVEALRAELRARWAANYKIEDVPGGLRLQPVYPAGCGEEYQLVTLEV